MGDLGRLCSCGVLPPARQRLAPARKAKAQAKNSTARAPPAMRKRAKLEPTTASIIQGLLEKYVPLEHKCLCVTVADWLVLQDEGLLELGDSPEVFLGGKTGHHILHVSLDLALKSHRYVFPAFVKVVCNEFVDRLDAEAEVVKAAAQAQTARSNKRKAEVALQHVEPGVKDLGEPATSSMRSESSLGS